MRRRITYIWSRWNAIVYLLGPRLDNLFRNIKKQIIVPFCIILLLIFVADFTYSMIHPNMGEGITDYDTNVKIEKN